MKSTIQATNRALLSVVLSIVVSAAATWILRTVLTAAMNRPGEPDGPPDHEKGRPNPRRGANINPVSVFVFVPIFAGNSNNTIGPRQSFLPKGNKVKR